MTGPVLVLVEFYNGDVSATYFIKVLYVFLHCMSMLLVVVVPRAYRYLGGDVTRDDDEEVKEQGGVGGAEDCFGPMPTLGEEHFQIVSDNAGHESMQQIDTEHSVETEEADEQHADDAGHESVLVIDVEHVDEAEEADEHEHHSDNEQYSDERDDQEMEGGESGNYDDKKRDDSNTDTHIQSTKTATGDNRSRGLIVPVRVGLSFPLLKLNRTIMTCSFLEKNWHLCCHGGGLHQS
jgi:hypothetical protein